MTEQEILEAITETQYEYADAPLVLSPKKLAAFLAKHLT